jgi:hypothetical protein
MTNASGIKCSKAGQLLKSPLDVNCLSILLLHFFGLSLKEELAPPRADELEE